MPLPPLAASTTHATVDPSGGTVTPLTPGSHAAGAAVGLTYAASAASAAGTAIGTGSTPGSTLTAGAVVAVERLPQPALPADAASLADATGGAGTPRSRQFDSRCRCCRYRSHRCWGSQSSRG